MTVPKNSIKLTEKKDYRLLQYFQNGKEISRAKVFTDGSREVVAKNFPCTCGKKISFNSKKEGITLPAGYVFTMCHTTF